MGKFISEIEPYNKKPNTGNVIISKRAEAISVLTILVTDNFVLVKTKHMLTSELLKLAGIPSFRVGFKLLLITVQDRTA